MRFFLFLFLLFVPAFVPITAKADYFVWQDAESRLSVSFPDTWKMQNNRNISDILTVVGPSEGDNPVCTIKAEDDKRYTIFPKEYGSAVQRVAVSKPFWDSYMGHYDDYTLDKVYDGGGLGRWLASYAFGSYSRRNGTAYEQRRAIMFASLYYDTLYIVECSSLNHAFENWQKNFQSIIKSVDFKKIIHEHKQGHYANFLKEADLYFWSQTGPDGTISY
jgi:hypothetical protein